MAIILYNTADKTVNTIADRNAIVHKIDNMVVTVLDAIADVDAGPGWATYKWNVSLNKWLLLSKATIDTMSFETVELVIVDGKVTPPNVPVNNVIWDILVMDGDVILAELKLEDLAVTPSAVNNLSEFNGKKLRFTYAYGSITSQIESYMDSRINELTAAAPIDLDSFKEVADIIQTLTDPTSAVNDFEEALI